MTVHKGVGVEEVIAGLCAAPGGGILVSGRPSSSWIPPWTSLQRRVKFNIFPTTETEAMAIFSRFFKTKPAETLEQRLAAVDRLPQDQLVQMATQPGEESLRLAAVKNLSFGQPLLDLAIGDAAGQTLRTSARKRIGELLDAGAVDVASLHKAVVDPSLLLGVCAYSNRAGSALIEQVDDEALLCEIATSGTTTQQRQAAAQRLANREILERLAKQAKLKDKSVYKIVRSKLDAFREEKTREVQLAAEVTTLCAQAEQLAKRNVDDIFVVRKQQIENAWQAYAVQASTEARRRYEQAIEKCQQKLRAIAEQEQLLEAARAAEREAKKELHRALGGLQEFLAKLYGHANPAESGEELGEKIAVSESALREAGLKGLDTGAEKHRLRELAQAAREVFEKLQQAGPLAKLLEDLESAGEEQGKKLKEQVEFLVVRARYLKEVQAPAIIDRSRHILDEWTHRVNARADQGKQAIKDAADLIRKGTWAVSQGYVGRARALLREIEEKTGQLEHLPPHLAGKLEEFKIAIQKLGDWHEFAVNPKKQELVKQMQELQASQLHPKDLADKIQALQDAWKELCRGGQQQDETLWQEFHTAAQQAYEPCKLYFEAQSQIREQNAAQRRALMDRLNEYLQAYDWENANWKEVEKTLRVAREAWMSYWPIPRKDGKDMQKAFDEIMDKLYEKLNQEYERNRQKKLGIVSQAQKLLELSETSAAIDGAKKLQAQWQTIGHCKRKDDQALWQEFRVCCDAIFAKRHQESEALKEERQSAKNHAETILAQLQEILGKSGEEFFTAKNQADQLATEFQSIGELPRESARVIAERFQQLTEQIQQKVHTERQTAVARSWQEVFRIADRIRQLELEHLNGGKTELESANIKNEIDQAQIKWPYESKEVLQQRLANASGLTSEDQAAAEEKLRLLCIRSEILTGHPTPESDRGRRMQFQVAHLQQNFGQSPEANDHKMLDLFLEWLATAGVPGETYAPLHERFTRCWHLGNPAK